jgi:hypothetical protein
VLTSLLTVLTTFVALFALTGYQVTTETAAVRLLSRLSAAIIEVDRWLPGHMEDIDLLARDRPDSVVRVSDVPIGVTLPAAPLIGANEATVRVLLLDAMGRALYSRGNDAFLDNEGGQSRPGITEPVYWTVFFLENDRHSFWKATLPLTLLILLGVCAATLHAGRSLLVYVATGASAAAFASLATVLLAEAGSNAFGSPIDKEIALIIHDGAWIGLRDSLAVAAVAGGLLLMIRLLNPQTERWREAPPPEAPSA